MCNLQKTKLCASKLGPAGLELVVTSALLKPGKTDNVSNRDSNISSLHLPACEIGGCMNVR